MTALIFDSSIYGDVAAIPYPVRTNATESLEYYTDVLQSYTNEAEERAQLRALPRQFMSYRHDASFGYMQEIYNAVRANLRGKWLVPLWFELQSVVVAVDQSTFAVDTLLHDLRVNTHALIFKSLCEWQIVRITEKTDTSITTFETCTLQGRAFIVPFRVGRLTGNANASPTGYNNSFQLQYLVDDVLTGLTETPPQYNGKDFYTKPYLTDGKGSVQIIQPDDQLEFNVGGINSDTNWKRTVETKEYGFDGQGIAEYRAFKNYFYRRAGRFRPFYSPSFESNLQNRSTGTVVNTFKFKNEGYDALFANIKRIGFRLADGTWQVRSATATLDLGGGEAQISLDTPLNVAAKDIELVSFVSLNRLDTDRVELQLGQNQYFQTSASVVEIPE